MRKVLATTTLAAIVVVSACSDRGPTSAPIGVRRSAVPGASTMGTCTTVSNLLSLANQVFGSGSPNVNSVTGKINNLEHQVSIGDATAAADQAHNIVNFVRDKAAEGRLAGTPAQIDQLLGGVLCFAGLDPNTFLIQPTDQPQVVAGSNTNGSGGISLQGETVTVPTLITITFLDPSGPSGLITKLDQYPTFINITSSSQLTKPSVVAICLGVPVRASVFNRLRLGHQALAGFEITPVADASFLNCPTNVASASRVPGWLKSLASIVIPKPLYARQEEEPLLRGGVGGSATEYSPFDAVDPELRAAGGVGGSATEYQRRPAAPSAFDTLKGSNKTPTLRAPSTGNRANTVSGGVCTAVEAIVGTALEPECRPVVTITRAQGPSWTGGPGSGTVGLGGGSIAASTVASQTCGATYGSSAATSSDAAGKAGVCWNMGPAYGTNTTIATASAGGDAPPGVTFVPASTTFTGTALRITPTAAATGASVTFDGADHAGSGTCSNGLIPALSYSGDGSVPHNVGSYTLTVSCGGGNVYNLVTATASISIAQFASVAAVTCPTSVVYTGSAQTPCSATVTGPGLSLTPVPDYSNNTNGGTATASITYAGGGNYTGASASATFAITPAPTVTSVTCPASVVYNAAAQTPCTATTTGAALSLTPTPGYSNNTNVGTASASASFAATANHQASSDSKTFAITAAPSITTVSCPASVVYTGAAQTPCSASVAGVGGFSQTVAVSYANNTNAGTATASATFGSAGNFLGSTDSKSFGITPAPSATTVSCPASVPYNGADQTPCTASVTGVGGLSQSAAVSYVPGTPHNAGSYSASASFAGDANHSGSNGSAGVSVTQRSATATAGNGTMNFGTTVPALSCTVSGLLAGDAGTVTCTTPAPTITVAGSYATVPTVSPASPVNYAVTKVNGTLTVVAYVQDGCFSSPIYSVMPSTKSSQNKGSNLPVKCALRTPQGANVTWAHGDLLVQDKGVDGLAAPTTAFSGTDVFRYSNSGNYQYGLDTGLPTFITGHYYYVTATWNDGSKTYGWFYIK